MIEAEMRVYVFTDDITDDIKLLKLSLYVLNQLFYAQCYNLSANEQCDKCTANKKGGGGQWALSPVGHDRRKIRLIEGNAKCRHLKKLTCKGT